MPLSVAPYIAVAALVVVVVLGESISPRGLIKVHIISSSVDVYEETIYAEWSKIRISVK